MNLVLFLINCAIAGIVILLLFLFTIITQPGIREELYWKFYSSVKKIDISAKEIVKKELVTVYAFREFTIEISEQDSGEKFRTLGDEERVLSGLDHYCLVCKSTIGTMARRVLHSIQGSECYLCYRKRIDCGDFQKFLLIAHLPWIEEVDNLSKLLFLEYYRALREEMLVIRPAKSFKETDIIVPTFNHYLSLFPEIHVPEWINEKFVWSAYDYRLEDCPTLDILLWERVLPKRNRKIALAHLVKEFRRVREEAIKRGKVFRAYPEQ